MLAAVVASALAVPALATAASIADPPFGQSAAQRVAAAAAVPAQFRDSIALSGLTNPVAVRFAPDGSVFVAEKRGRVLRFASLSDPTADTVVAVEPATHDFWDRGLLGLAVDPGYPARPYVYVSYTYDHILGSTSPAPRWGDDCPTPPGATENGCVVSGRISRFTMQGQETVLVEDFCQQFPSHSIGGLAFGADGALYASAGDGASFNYADHGQTQNPCGDPPGEGGSLRSQDLRTRADPTSMDGSILRLDPSTGAAMRGNPLAQDAEVGTRRIVAQGLRNPFRITVRPGTNEVWAADVGWSTWEEIDRLQAPTAGVANFGWPCYEGAGRMGTWDALDNPVCEGLYSSGTHTAPHYTYDHAKKVVAGESCGVGSSSISGLAFYDGGTFPAEYTGALFFADYARGCVWAMLRGANGLPDPAKLRTFVTQAAVVDLAVGPGGDLFYADIARGEIHRVRATSGNRAPTAVAGASPDRGPLPLDVTLTAAGSSDPDGEPLAYAWALDADGVFDDGSQATVTRRYGSSGTFTARLRVRDPNGLEDVAQVQVYAGVPPTAEIATPAAGTTWEVGQTVGFSGSGRSASGAALPPETLSWRLDLHHCSTLGGCHVHPIRTWSGTASGSFAAPDHEYPSYLELGLTAAEAGLSASASRIVQPRTVELTVATDPQGLQVFAGAEAGAAPLTRQVIVGSTTSIGAVSPQEHDGGAWAFCGWPDAGPPSRDVVAGGADATYTALFAPVRVPAGDPPPAPDPERPADSLPPAAAPVDPPRQPVAAPAPRGPLAAWSFDDRGSGARVPDATGSGHSATLRGGARRTAHGRYGRGLLLDGADASAVAPARAGLALRSAFTLEAWVRPARGGRAMPVVAGERPGSTAFALAGAARRPARWNVRAAARTLQAQARLRARRWSHVALAWDGATLQLFVNGRAAGRHAATGGLGPQIVRLRLGGDFHAGRWLRGRLDEVRIYDRALGAAEVAADMRRPLGSG